MNQSAYHFPEKRDYKTPDDIRSSKLDSIRLKAKKKKTPNFSRTKNHYKDTFKEATNQNLNVRNIMTMITDNSTPSSSLYFENEYKEWMYYEGPECCESAEQECSCVLRKRPRLLALRTQADRNAGST